MKKLITFWVLLIHVLTIVCGCGVTTHNVIAHHASLWLPSEFTEYDRIIKENQDAFQNGAAFPDWGYNCILFMDRSELPSASEAAHWPPFQKSVAEYLNTVYPKPWNATAEKLVAFLLGMSSHSTADVIWHNLARVRSTGQGFIQSLADSDFNAQGKPYSSAAHNQADVGGEFMAAYELDLSFLSRSWYLPSEDLAKIYQKLGFDQVTPIVLEACNTELYAEVIAISTLPSELLYPHFAAKAPFLVEQYQDWWLGGVNDMSAWTTWCWSSVFDWLQGNSTVPPCLPFITSSFNKSLQEVQYLHIKSEMASRKMLQETLKSQLKGVNVTTAKTNGGVEFSNSQFSNLPFKKNILSKPCHSKSRNSRAGTCISQAGSRGLNFLSDTRFALLGYSTATGDFNNDGVDDVAVGAPGFSMPGLQQIGSVQIALGGKRSFSELNPITVPSVDPKELTMSIVGNIPNARFGMAVTALDFNKDGFEDLAVSSPGTQSQILSYVGMVQIFFGSALGISLVPNITIVAHSKFTNLGTTLQSFDIDGDSYNDLLIGSPYSKATSIQSGEMWVFLSSETRHSGQILDSSHADWRAHGENFFEWFGYHSTVAEHDGQRTLIIGAPMYSNGDTPLGRLYGYDITSFNHTENGMRSVNLKWIITGSDPQGKFGFSFDYGNPIPDSPLLAVGIPTATVDAEHFWQQSQVQAGSIVLFSISNLSGNHSLKDIKLHAHIYSDEEFSRLGWKVKFSKNRGTELSHLIVSEPWRDRSRWPSDGDAGAVYIWKGGKEFPSGTIRDVKSSANVCILSSTGKALYGYSFEVSDFNGDGAIDLLLGGPRDKTMRVNGGSASLILSLLE